ncbi:ABC transporter ATP-binding protein [Rhodovarius sp.]|jgi:branched-chain amino acid transport system ATP-binding protein|uniref:ABC transporter ATP-binding protein n=1 Tax=Rhodovarius sp. TaxID=2972673 RepID=UPI00333F0804
MLSVRDLHAGYGEAQVLHGVSLEITRGAVHALLGRNGMGKSTLVRAMMGLSTPRITAGDVMLGETRLNGMAPHRIARAGVALVPQGRRLFASLTVSEHLTILKPASARHGWTVARVFEAFPRLAQRKSHRGNQLSGGERQMLAVGRALMADPSFILMDEPSEGLAPVMVQALEGVVALLRDEGLGVLLVEQNLYSALAVADRVSVLEGGQIVHSAPIAESPAETLTRFLGVH